MKKIYLLLIVVLFLLCIVLLGKNFYNDTKGKESEIVHSTLPEFQIVNLDELNKGNIVSLTLVDKNKIIATLDPKPNIISFDFSQESGFKISNIYQRDSWRLNGVDFVDSSNGFAVGGYGTILKTMDGGVTWNQLPQFSEFDFHQVNFLNQSVGYVAGKYGIRNKKTQEDEWQVEIWRTEDGGNSWKKSYQGDKERDVFQIAIFSSEIALASINGNRLIRTEDGGQSWKEVAYNGKRVTSIIFAPDKTGWLVGSRGEFLESEDAGSTWQEPNNFPTDLHNYEWWSIDFDNKGNGLAVSEEGVTVFTNDNGESWKKLSQKVSEPLRSVKIKDGVGIILGEENIYKLDF